jgi:N-terminal region of glycosyl transferase group 7
LSRRIVIAREHLRYFVPALRAYFARDKLDRDIPYRALTIEQEPGLPFNHGALNNIGSLIGRGGCDYTCFHDVDYLPASESSNFGCRFARSAVGNGRASLFGERGRRSARISLPLAKVFFRWPNRHTNSERTLYMTTLIQIVTAAAIILASDSKEIDDPDGNLNQTTKMALLSKTTAVADCNLSKLDTSSNRSLPAIKYDFRTWVQQFADITDPIQLTEAIAEEAKKTFEDVGPIIQKQLFKKRENLTDFYVAGYSSGAIPVIIKIDIPLDWENAKVLDPTIELRYPPSSDPAWFGNAGWWFVNAGCKHDAIDRAEKKDGPPYARLRKLEPGLTDKLIDKKDLTVEEAKRLASALVAVQAESTPADVEPPVQIIQVDKP